MPGGQVYETNSLPMAPRMERIRFDSSAPIELSRDIFYTNPWSEGYPLVKLEHT